MTGRFIRFDDVRWLPGRRRRNGRRPVRRVDFRIIGILPRRASEGAGAGWDSGTNCDTMAPFRTVPVPGDV